MFLLAEMLIEEVFVLVCWLIGRAIAGEKHIDECTAAAVIVAVMIIATTVKDMFRQQNENGEFLPDMFGRMAVRLIVTVVGAVAVIKMLDMQRMIFVVWLLVFYAVVLACDNLILFIRLKKETESRELEP